MPKNLRVIQIIDSLEVGGAEMMSINIANALAEQGVYSHLCVTRQNGLLSDKISKQVSVIILEKAKTIDIKAFYRLYQYIKKEDIQVIHAHSSSYFIATIIKLWIPKLKIIWHDHYGLADEIANRKKFPINCCSFLFSYIISVNEILKKWAVANLNTKKVEFCANFATLDHIQNLTTLKKKETFKIVCTAVFRPQKNHLNLLKAFLELSIEKDNVSLHLLGFYDPKDLYYLKVKQFVVENNLYQKVFFYGACSDIGNVLKQADLGVLSSSSEGLPVALLEYGLAGLPVVVTDVGECKNVVQNYGLVVPPNHKFALYDALKQMIEDKNKREKMAIGFQNHIQNNYSKKSYINTLLKIYKSC